MDPSTRCGNYIHPEGLYPIQGFEIDSGISKTRRREAKKRGVPLPVVTVGKRKFVRGADGIEYILRLSELHQGTAAEESLRD